LGIASLSLLCTNIKIAPPLPLSTAPSVPIPMLSSRPFRSPRPRSHPLLRRLSPLLGAPISSSQTPQFPRSTRLQWPLVFIRSPSITSSSLAARRCVASLRREISRFPPDIPTRRRKFYADLNRGEETLDDHEWQAQRIVGERQTSSGLEYEISVESVVTQGDA
jgi:hypothetical protein